MTNYPGNIDTDADLPRVDDNITETGSEALNAMRDAIFAIEEAIGLNPQGATSTLVNRLSRSLNEDGTLKASALIASGLIALPIVNSQVSPTAAIEEVKLNLDVATQDLQNQITSNDVDIAALQKVQSSLLNDFSSHFNGTSLRHDTFDIDLNSAFPSATPPELPGLVATDLHDLLVEMNNRFIDHAATSKVGAHQASNISVDGSNFLSISPLVSDTQGALEALDQARATEFEVHRDEMHANGFSSWANNIDGYNTNLQKFPTTLGGTSSGEIVTGLRNVFQFTSGSGLAGLGIFQGDTLSIETGGAAGTYVIDDIGPRSSVGLKPALDGYQVEIVGTFPDGYDGYANATVAAIFGASSVFTLRGNGTPTICQIADRVDSLQLARPNAARAVSLGIRPALLTSDLTLSIRVGTGLATRTITIDNLVLDRNNIIASPVTVDTVIERINHVFQNSIDGYAFPAAAYRIGDELMIAHNWYVEKSYTLEILSSGTANFLLGFDGYGANVVDNVLYPTRTAYFYVNGKRYNDYTRIANTTATVTGPSSTIVTLDGINPLNAGVKTGHLLHLKDHPISTTIGTYIITNVTASTVTVHSAIPVGSNLPIEILHDALPLHDFRNNTRDLVIEAFIDASGRLGYNERLSYTDSIVNVTVVGVSNNFVAADYNLIVGSTATSKTFQLDNGKIESVPLNFSGFLNVYSPDNIEFITINVASPAGTGTTDVVINQHIDEEEVLEVCSARINGLITVSQIKDKRLFGSTGLDELREDVVQAYVETPLQDLRSNGIIDGFDVIQDGYVDLSLFPNNHGLVIRGGTAYVAGSRCRISTELVIIPNTGSPTVYTIAFDALGTYYIVDEADYTIAELLDGYNGELALVAKVTHDGFQITNVEDLRFFINDMDEKVELILDLTNHMIGQFATVDAAINYANNYPSSEKFRIRIVSRTGDNITIPAGSRDITLDLDGYVGSITANSKFKLTSSSCTERTMAHVLGNIDVASGCLLADMENVTLDGYVNFEGTTAQVGVFDGITFSGNDARIKVNGTSTDRITINNCRFLSNYGGIDVTSVGGLNSLRISKSHLLAGTITVSSGNNAFTMNECVLTDTFISVATNTFINDCRFVGYSTITTPIINSTNFAGAIVVDGCSFNTITTSGTTSMIGDGNLKQITVRNSTFDEINLSGTATMMNNPSGIIHGCQFMDNIYPTSTRSVICQQFVENTNTGFGGGDVIVSVGETFKSNTGFHGVTTQAAALRLVENNTFMIGANVNYNVDLSNLDAGEECIISGNYFFIDDFSGTKSNILCGTSTSDVVITGNFLRGTTGSAGTSVGINLVDATAGNFLITNNLFSELDTAVSSTNPILNVTLTNNDFGIIPVAFFADNGLNFSGNILSTAASSIGGTSLANATISNNLLNSTATLTINVPLSNTLIFGNRGSTIIFGSGSNCQSTTISSNLCDFDALAGGTNFLNTVFTENISTFNNVNRIYWQNSIISENVFNNTSLMEFTLSDVGSDALVSISKNTFNGSVALSAVSATLDKIDFSDNISLNNTSGLTTNQTLNNSFITKNIQFSITILGGANSSTISTNNAPEQQIILTGVINSTKTDNNVCGTQIAGSSGIVLDCNSSAGLTVSNNIVFGGMDIFYTSPAGVASIVGANISNNSIIGDIGIGNGILSIDSLELRQSTISNNIARGLLVFKVSTATGTYIFTDNIISNSTFSGNIEILDLNGDFGPNVSIRDNFFNGNSANSINFLGGLGLVNITYSGISVIDNKFGILQIGNNLVWRNMVISGNQVLDVNMELNFLPSSTGVIGMTFSGNTIVNSFNCSISSQSGGRIVIEKFNILNNIMPGIDMNFSVPNTTIGAETIFQSLNCQNNIIRAFSFIDTFTTRVMSFEGCNISNNVFDGTSGGVFEPGIFFSGCNLGRHLSINNNTVALGNLFVGPRPVSTYRAHWKNCNPFVSSTFNGNNGLSMLIEDSSGFQGTITGNVYFGGSAYALAGTAVVQNVSRLIISNNEGLSIDWANANSITDIIITDNIASDSGNIINLSGTDTIENLVISNNKFGSTNFSIGTNETLLLENITTSIKKTSVVGNIWTGNDNVSLSFNNCPLIQEIVVSANTCNDITFNDVASLDSSIISNNVARRLTFVTTSLGSSNISNNKFLSILFTGAPILVAVSLIGNEMIVGGAPSIGMASVASINICDFSNNICNGVWELPDDAAWSPGSLQTKMISNIASSFTAPNSLTTAGATRLFPWGNTSNSTTNVTFSGTTASNPTTANNLTGAGIVV